MPTFYYLAVSNADGRKIYGETEAENEAVARRDLNRMGMSILTVATHPLEKKAEAVSKRSFEFEALDKDGKDVTGTIEADGDEHAFDRLLSEFSFKVSYICAESATDAEKTTARMVGIQPILDIKKRRKEQEIARKNTFAGRLGSFVKMEEKEVAEALSGGLKVDVAIVPKKNGLTLDDEPVLPAAKKIEIVKEEKIEADSLSATKAAPKLEAEVEKTAEVKPVIEVEKPIEKVSPPADTKFVLPKLNFNFDFQKFWQQLPFVSSAVEQPKTDSEPRIPWDEQAWLLVRFAFGTLTGLYLAYALLAFIALQSPLGGFSNLARATLTDNQLVPFFGFAALLIWLTLLARDHLIHSRTLRFSLLCSFTVLTLLITGINVL